MSEAPSIVSSTNKEVEGVEQIGAGEKKKKRKLTSKVWDDLTRVPVSGVEKAKCNHCGVHLTIPESSTTTHLKRHLKTCAAHAAAKSGSQDYASKALEGRCSGEISSHGDGGSGNTNEKTSRDEFEKWASQMNTMQPSKNEMDIYLEETFFKGVDNTFSVLEWWKANTLKFPILSMMARDILSIPTNTVASESTFSAGRRVLDDYRSSMNFETIEALLCTGNWLRHEYGIHTSSKEEDD